MLSQRVPTLQTECLRLRPYVADDFSNLHSMLSDPQHMRWYPGPLDEAGARHWMRWIRRHYRVWGYGLWLTETHDGDYVGHCGLMWQYVDRGWLLELGWHTRRALWGRGFAPEAARAARGFATDEVGVERIISLIRPENVQSARVAEKLGMKVWRETTYAGLRHHVYSQTLE